MLAVLALFLQPLQRTSGGLGPGVGQLLLLRVEGLQAVLHQVVVDVLSSQPRVPAQVSAASTKSTRIIEAVGVEKERDEEVEDGRHAIRKAQSYSQRPKYGH